MRTIPLLLLLLLGACSSQPDISYYQLPAVVAGNAGDNAKPLYIEPVQVAGYLNGRGLVLQVSDVELVMARQHLWAEALDQQLQRQLRDLLATGTAGFSPVLQAGADTPRLTVQLARFHGQPDGYAVISGRFAISSQPGSQAFTLRVPLANDGYPALVTALAEGLQQLSTLISLQLQQAG